MATVTSVTNHFITAKEGFSTTLASSISSGATTVPLNSTAGYTDGDVVALTIEPASATAKQVFTGIKSGTSIINVVWTEGTNQAHAAGVTVIDYTTATHQAALVKGLLVGNNQNGTRKAFTESSIVPTAAIQNSAITTAKIADSNITAAKLINGYAKKRQGGSATDFTVTGTTNYDISSLDLKIQIGTVMSSLGETTITFPEAFTQKPMIYLTSSSASASNVFVRYKSSTVTTTGFGGLSALNNSGAVANEQINWMAIG